VSALARPYDRCEDWLQSCEARELRAIEVEETTMRAVTRIFMAVLLAAVVAGCATRARSIADLKYDPGRYHDRTVSVQGVVTSSWGVPMLPVKL
jgi:hypothetical protein